MGQVEQVAAPFIQHIASLAVKDYDCVILDGTEIALEKNVHSIESLRIPDSLRSMENHDILVYIKSNS